MEEKILLELEKLQEEKKKIEEEKNTAFDLLTRITEQKNQVEETIEEIQNRENLSNKREQDLEIVLQYIKKYSNDENIKKEGDKDEIIEQDV